MSEVKRKIDSELKGIVADSSELDEIIKRAQKEEKVISMGKKGKNLFKAAGIAAAITVLSVGTVLGVEYYQRIYQKTENVFDNHLGNADEGAPVYDIPSEAAVNSGVVENGSKAADVEMEWGKYTVEPHKATFLVTLRSKDGSPLVEETEDKVPFLNRAGFENIAITVDGKTSNYPSASNAVVDPLNPNGGSGSTAAVFCVNSTEDLSRIDFEVWYTNYDIDLAGKEIGLEFKDLNVCYNVFEGIEAKGTLGELLEGAAAADASAFVSVDEQRFWDYELQPGVNHIAFSDRYPDCYIDNFGFMPRKYDGAKSFYMTVVCDAASTDELMKMNLQSVRTGLPELYDKGILADGRIQYVYNVNSDFAFWDVSDGGKNHIDTTMEHVSTLLPKKLLERQDDVKAVTGTWSNTVLLEGTADMITREIEAVIPSVTDAASVFTATSLQYNGLRIKIDGVMNEDFDFAGFGMNGKNTPVAVMKDGSRIQVDGKGEDGAMADFNTGTMKTTFYFTAAVNPQDIVAVEWHGVTVWSVQ